MALNGSFSNFRYLNSHIEPLSHTLLFHLSQHVYGYQNQFVLFWALSVGKSMSKTPTVFQMDVDN